jgi:hypothetical protein
LTSPGPRAAAAALALCLLACQPSPEQPIRDQLQALEAALRYQDLAGVYRLHVDSVGPGALCHPDRLALWERTADPSPRACREAAALFLDPSPASEELALLSEIVVLRCQHPALGCQDASAILGQEAARRSALLERPTERLEIQRVELRGPDEAVAYIDLRGPGEENPRRVTLHLARAQGRWLLASWP